MSELTIAQKNQMHFTTIRRHGFPIGQYAIVGSGPLGIRNLRAINDIDIIVTPELQKKLADLYGVTDDGTTLKIIFPEDPIEAFWEGSFYSVRKDPSDFTVAEKIANAEILDGLPFEPLESVIRFKRKMNREKDLRDILLIEQWLLQRSQN